MKLIINIPDTAIPKRQDILSIDLCFVDGQVGQCTYPFEVLQEEEKTGHCKDCKYFEYDSVAKVDGIPLIVAHEICSRWGNGCKTREDGYCFLFEPQKRSE